jgi:hypothetical protein
MDEITAGATRGGLAACLERRSRRADTSKRYKRGTRGEVEKLTNVLPVGWNGAGGGNRTHGLGIMRPSLYH